MNRITCFTPTYNRKNTLHRVYESLLSQTYKNFEWLIIDDGSSDNTKELIDSYIKENKIQIKYYYQENQGKHIAVNNAIKKTNTELFIIADSDDSFVSNAFETLINAWDSIDNKPEFNGVICRVFEHDTKIATGEFPSSKFISNSIEACYTKKIRFENWQLFTTKSLKEFPFPEINGLKFFPETVIWQKMALKYNTLYIDDKLREYYRDQNNSLVSKKRKNFRENVHLWEHYINNFGIFFLITHFFEAFIKSYVGISLDYFMQNKKCSYILKIPNTLPKKFFVLLFIPASRILFILKRVDIK